MNVERARGGKDAAACDVVGGGRREGAGQRKRVCCVCGGARDALMRWPQGTTARGVLVGVLLSEAFCGIDVLSPQLQKPFFGCPVVCVLCEEALLPGREGRNQKQTMNE